MQGKNQTLRASKTEVPATARGAVEVAEPDLLSARRRSAPQIASPLVSPLQRDTLAGLQRTLGNRHVAGLINASNPGDRARLRPLAAGNGQQVINRLPAWLERLIGRMRRRGAPQPAAEPAPPQAGGMEEVEPDQEPPALKPGQVDAAGVDAHLDEHLPRPYAHKLREENPDMSDKEILKAWGNSDEAMRIKYRGERKQNLLAATRNGPAGAGNEPALKQQIESARQSRGKGACNIVATEMAGYLGKCGIPVSASHLKDGLGGNHAINFFRAGSDIVIFDATWQQFAAQLGIHSHAKCDPTLVGTVDEIEDLIEGWSVPDPTRNHLAFRKQYLSFLGSISAVTAERFTESAEDESESSD